MLYSPIFTDLHHHIGLINLLQREYDDYWGERLNCIIELIAQAYPERTRVIILNSLSEFTYIRFRSTRRYYSSRLDINRSGMLQNPGSLPPYSRSLLRLLVRDSILLRYESNVYFCIRIADRRVRDGVLLLEIRSYYRDTEPHHAFPHSWEIRWTLIMQVDYFFFAHQQKKGHQEYASLIWCLSSLTVFRIYKVNEHILSKVCNTLLEIIMNSHYPEEKFRDKVIKSLEAGMSTFNG